MNSNNDYSCAFVVNKQHSDGTQSEVIKVPLGLCGLSSSDVSYLRYLLSTGVDNPITEFKDALSEGKFDSCPADKLDTLTYIVQSTAKYWEGDDTASVLKVAMSMVCDIALGNILVTDAAASCLNYYMSGDVGDDNNNSDLGNDFGESLDENEEQDWYGTRDDATFVETTEEEPSKDEDRCESEIEDDTCDSIPSDPVVETSVVSDDVLESQKQARIDLDERTSQADTAVNTETPAEAAEPSVEPDLISLPTESDTSSDSESADDDYLAESDFSSNDFLDEQPEPVKPVDRLEEDIDKLRIALPSREAREERNAEPVAKSVSSEPRMPLHYTEPVQPTAMPDTMPIQPSLQSAKPAVKPLIAPEKFNTGRMPLHRDDVPTQPQLTPQNSRTYNGFDTASVVAPVSEISVPSEDYADEDKAYMSTLFTPDEIEDDSDSDI